jgi:hypothetical protein
VHYLETKDEALLALQAYLIFVKKVTGVTVALVIRSDNESVFVQGKFRGSFLQPARDHAGDLCPVPTRALGQWARG